MLLIKFPQNSTKTKLLVFTNKFSSTKYIWFLSTQLIFFPQNEIYDFNQIFHHKSASYNSNDALTTASPKGNSDKQRQQIKKTGDDYNVTTRDNNG